MTIIIDINFFDIVYLINDPQQLPRQFTDLEVSPGEGDHYGIIYTLASVGYSTRHYRREFTTVRDEVKILLNPNDE